MLSQLLPGNFTCGCYFLLATLETIVLAVSVVPSLVHETYIMCAR